MTTDNVTRSDDWSILWIDSQRKTTYHDFAANGRHGTDAYYRAWQWCVAVCLNNPRPELTWNAEKAMHRIQMSPRDLYGFRQY